MFTGDRDFAGAVSAVHSNVWQLVFVLEFARQKLNFVLNAALLVHLGAGNPWRKRDLSAGIWGFSSFFTPLIHAADPGYQGRERRAWNSMVLVSNLLLDFKVGKDLPKVMEFAFPWDCHPDEAGPPPHTFPWPLLSLEVAQIPSLLPRIPQGLGMSILSSPCVYHTLYCNQDRYTQHLS